MLSLLTNVYNDSRHGLKVLGKLLNVELLITVTVVFSVVLSEMLIKLGLVSGP